MKEQMPEHEVAGFDGGAHAQSMWSEAEVDGDEALATHEFKAA